jgi:predicted dehydrogenase
MSVPEKLRVAVLGAGAAAQRYYLPALNTWSDKLTLAGLCESAPQRRQQVGRQVGCDELYDDYAQMLDGCACDAVAILTPHANHARQCLQALKAGRHVMIEKPLALSTADAVEIAEVAEARGLAISCAPPTMLHPGQRRLKQLVEQGAIGKVCLVRITRSSMGPGSQPGAPTDTSWFYQKGAGGLSSRAGPRNSRMRRRDSRCTRRSPLLRLILRSCPL